MQTVITIGIVLAAAGYLAWVWAPKRKAADVHGSPKERSACSGCDGCARC
jgi:hypothetical protein